MDEIFHTEIGYRLLVAGQVYYIDALMKEGSGSDNLAVGWSKPGQSTNSPSQVIPGSNLMTQYNPAPDTQAPSAPTNLVVSNLTETSLDLSWNASSDNVSVSGYDVFKNGIKINSTQVTSTSYPVNGLTSGTNYAFILRQMTQQETPLAIAILSTPPRWFRSLVLEQVPSLINNGIILQVLLLLI